MDLADIIIFSKIIAGVELSAFQIFLVKLSVPVALTLMAILLSLVIAGICSIVQLVTNKIRDYKIKKREQKKKEINDGSIY